MLGLKKLKTLVMMQLKDKLDMSYVRSVRSLIIRIVLFVLQIAAVTAVFYVLFYLSIRLRVFSLSGSLPDKVLTVLFTVMQLLAIVSCTVGLTRALYMTDDNKVLLTLPVRSNLVFLSKIVLYYVFEVKRNVMYTMPIFLAYGMVCSAVWYYYPWMLFCFMFISLLPVAIGAFLSIPALYVGNVIKKFKWLQMLLSAIAAGLAVWGILSLISVLPENINLVGHWGSISAGIQNVLNKFAQIFIPFHYLNLMVVGGTLRISGRLFNGETFVYFAVLLGVLTVLIGFAFLLSRPLFLKMASKQFEFNKKTSRPKKNHAHKKTVSPFLEDLQRNFRSSSFIIKLAVQLFLPAIAIFFLNKLYAAMNTSLSGQTMTKTCNILVLLVMVLTFNCEYAGVYSRDGHARPQVKTRPINPAVSLFSRLIVRLTVILVGVVFAGLLYQNVAQLSVAETLAVISVGVFVGWAHLLWSAEMDLMKNQSDQYATVGVDFDNPNERNSTIIAFLLSALFAVMFYLVSDKLTNIGSLELSGALSGTIKVALVALALLIARVYLYFTRIKLYYVEK